MEKLILIYSNVLQLSKTITDAKDEKEIFIYIFLLFSYLAFLYLCCYSGQIMIDRSQDVFKESYNSTWYCMPIKAQKLLLFMMLRSSTESVINLFGFFVASHVGFSKLLSTSFSYFTVIYSSQ
ncbi:putative odorant receptor 92a isoform X1 [Bombus pyrosoma]|nr:putative odorant receptor 92a isoform X1 [Bombus pyrosoma]